jgi:MOSC domain-containing protein YiiM
MWKGSVISIQIAPAKAAPMRPVAEVRAVPGMGLEGDRHFGNGCGPDREITLIEWKAIEALKRDYSVELPPTEARRDIVTRGVPLNHLVGREFHVGSVRLRGIRLCEPCAHLALLTQKEVLSGLIHRGGLRAQILSEGVIRIGDEITG